MDSVDMKRVLGVGESTLSEHLRIYKDPFELGEPPPTSMPVNAAGGDTVDKIAKENQSCITHIEIPHIL